MVQWLSAIDFKSVPPRSHHYWKLHTISFVPSIFDSTFVPAQPDAFRWNRSVASWLVASFMFWMRSTHESSLWTETRVPRSRSMYQDMTSVIWGAIVAGGLWEMIHSALPVPPVAKTHCSGYPRRCWKMIPVLKCSSKSSLQAGLPAIFRNTQFSRWGKGKLGFTTWHWEHSFHFIGTKSLV